MYVNTHNRQMHNALFIEARPGNLAMAVEENILKPIVKKIAEEQEYNDYTTDMSSISSGGANYTSQLYNITLSATGKDDIKLFAKVGVLGEEIRKTTNMQHYETEIMFYTKLVSKYREYEEQYELPTPDRLVLPKFYGASDEYMKEVVVLEDLIDKGYQTFDRFKYYDWEYASKCVEYLAKFHALSIRYRTDCPEEFENLNQKLVIGLSLEQLKFFYDKCIAIGLEAVSDRNKEKVTEFVAENFNDELFNAFFNPPRKAVLNHGDFRPSNIMHKTNDDGELEIVVVDYQVLRTGNPAADLINFLIAGSDEEFREKHFLQYLDHYYDEFSRMLRKLEINAKEVYSREQFDADVKQLLPFGLIFGLLILPVVTVEEQQAPKVEDGIDFDNVTVKPNILFQQRFDGLVSDYAKMGIL